MGAGENKGDATNGLSIDPAAVGLKYRYACLQISQLCA